MGEIVKYFLYGWVFLLSVTLIVLVISNTSKAEGLGVIGGGSSQPTSRGRAGLEENINRWTAFVAIAWMISCTVLYYFAVRNGWS